MRLDALQYLIERKLLDKEIFMCVYTYIILIYICIYIYYVFLIHTEYNEVINNMT